MMGGNPFGEGDIDPRKMAMQLRNTDRLAGMLTQEMPGWEASPAEIVADIINVQRADTKAMADALDVTDPETGEPVEIELMSPDRAADLLAGITDGDALDLVLVFNELSRKRNAVLQDLHTDDEHDAYLDQKESVMFTDDPDTYREEESDE